MVTKISRRAFCAGTAASTVAFTLPQPVQAQKIPPSDLFSQVITAVTSKSDQVYDPTGPSAQILFQAIFDTKLDIEAIEIERQDGKVYEVKLKPIDWNTFKEACRDPNNPSPESNLAYERYFGFHKELLLGLHVLPARQFKKPNEVKPRVKATSIWRNDQRQHNIALSQHHRSNLGRGDPSIVVSSDISEHCVALATDVIPVKGVNDTELFSYTLLWNLRAGLYDGAVHLGAGGKQPGKNWGQGVINKLRAFRCARNPQSFIKHGKPICLDGTMTPEGQAALSKLKAYYEINPTVGSSAKPIHRPHLQRQQPTPPATKPQTVPKPQKPEKAWTEKVFE